MTHRIALTPANDVAGSEPVPCALVGMSDLETMLTEVMEVRSERPGKRLTGEMLALADGLQQLATLCRRRDGDRRLIARLQRAISDGLDGVWLATKAHALAGLSADGTILVLLFVERPAPCHVSCRGERAHACGASA